jgi:hypothetical protein
MAKTRLNATYLVAEFLKTHGKGMICDMKKVCGCNNVGDRVMRLRNDHKWQINTVLLEVKDGIRIFEYQLIEVGRMPKMIM